MGMVGWKPAGLMRIRRRRRCGCPRMRHTTAYIIRVAAPRLCPTACSRYGNAAASAAPLLAPASPPALPLLLNGLGRTLLPALPRPLLLLLLLGCSRRIGTASASPPRASGSGADCVRRSGVAPWPTGAHARSRCGLAARRPDSVGSSCHQCCSSLPPLLVRAASPPPAAASRFPRLLPLCTSTQRSVSNRESVAARRICCGAGSCAAVVCRPGAASSAILVLWI